MNNHSITIINQLNLPIIVETWQTIKNGLSEYIDVHIDGGQTVTISSDTGEWFVNNMFYTSDINDKWIAAGYDPGFHIGKIRDSPCAKGNYVWLYHDDFILEYKIYNSICVIMYNK
jgi:hypothetical protein